MKISMYEHNSKIKIELEGELSFEVDLVVASQWGQRMADMAHNATAKIAEAKERHQTYTTTTEVDHHAFVQPAKLPPHPPISRRPRKSRRVQQNGATLAV